MNTLKVDGSGDGELAELVTSTLSRMVPILPGVLLEKTRFVVVIEDTVTTASVTMPPEVSPLVSA